MKKTTAKNKKTPVRRTRNSRKKHQKNRFSDGLKALLLVILIVALSAVISLTIISIHNVSKNNNNVSSSLIDQTDDTQSQTTTPVTVVPETQKKIDEPQPAKPVTPVNPSATPSRPVPVTNAVPSKPVENKGALIFVIDDAGNNLRELEPFLRIQGPLTIAVLPGLPYSAEAAKRIRAAGKEVILHQPMEAIGAQNPGPAAIISGMNANEIREVLTRNIAEVGPVAGMNNHQGSKITMDTEAMKTILSFCAENNIYFLDSRTTAETVVPVVAQQMGMKIAERNVFIDNEQNKDAMIRYISTGLTRAQRNGSAVMIGHTWSPDLAPLLAEMFPRYIEQGYTLKKVSDILK
ncbi:MAG: divergent polysaccharide deacetylase family protein [Treponema sp.]|nr:divergent polysaccharide deacetylase family protein [Treponema sp.]